MISKRAIFYGCSGGAVIWGILAVGACQVFAPIIDRTADATADAVDEYCRNFTPDQRTEFRLAVNDRLPDDTAVVVNCPGDQPDEIR